MKQPIIAVKDRRLLWTEAQFTDAVIGLAHEHGWLVAHFRPTRTKKGWRTAVQGDRGYPDLTMVRDGRLVFAELKSEKGRVAVAQKEWLVAVGGAVPEVYVWRPSDWEELAQCLE